MTYAAEVRAGGLKHHGARTLKSQILRHFNFISVERQLARDFSIELEH